MHPGLLPQVAPCIVSHNMALGGAQTAVLRMIQALPDWVRERTTFIASPTTCRCWTPRSRSTASPVGAITNEAPEDPSCWVLSYGNLNGLPARPTSLILHSWDDEGWRYVNKTYGHLRGMTVAGVSDQVLGRYAPWIEQGGHQLAGIAAAAGDGMRDVRGKRDADRIVVAWMGRPLESKGLMSLPYLLAHGRAARRPRLDRRRYRRPRIHPPACRRRRCEKFITLAREARRRSTGSTCGRSTSTRSPTATASKAPTCCSATATRRLPDDGGRGAELRRPRRRHA